MGMVLGLTMLGDENIERVLSDPPLIWRVLAPDDPDLYEASRREQSTPSLLRRLFGARSAPASAAAELILGEPEGISTDLDKAWHGIHYLLTGSASEGDAPLSFLVSGGRTVGAIHVGYCPARVFTAAETRTILEAIRGIGDKDLRSRFDSGDMTAKKIYPEIWSRGSPDEETIGYLLEHLAIMRGFLEQAVEAELGIVVSLS
jgi:Domain of unknown function (DUF1877)